MTFNKIPLALGFNSSTGNASGLVEFTLDLSNVGGVCEATPTDGQVLTWSGDANGEWCPSTVATGGGGGGSNVPDPNATGDLVQSTNGSTWSHIGSATFITNSNIVVDSDLTAYPTLAGNNTFTEANSFGVVGTKITTAGSLEIAGTTTINGTNGNLEVGSSFSVTNANGNVEIGGELSVQGSEFTSDGAVLANVDKNSLVITTNASAVSSLSGASGSIVYFEGTTPAPAFKTFAQILSNENYNISPGTTYAASPVLSHLTGNPLATVTDTTRAVVNNYTLPADTLAANKKVRITYLGRILQNTGGDVTITLHFYLGGTAILNSSAVFGSNATKRGFSIEVNVSRLATDVQLVTQEFKSAAATGGTTGAGTIGTTERSGFSSNGATEDESGTLVASLQVQYSAIGEGADQAAFELNDVLVEVI